MARSTVLLIMDMQAGNFSGDQPIKDAEGLLSRVALLLERARATDTQVIFVQNDGPAGSVDEPGTPGWEIHPRLEPCGGELVIRKFTPDAFLETGLEEELADAGTDRLVVCGLQTEFCVDTTVRRASSLGFEVILVSNAHGTWDGKVLTAEQIIAHHNSVLAGFFARLLPAEEIRL